MFPRDPLYFWLAKNCEKPRTGGHHSISRYMAGASSFFTTSETESTSIFTVRSPKRSYSTSPGLTS